MMNSEKFWSQYKRDRINKELTEQSYHMTHQERFSQIRGCKL